MALTIRQAAALGSEWAQGLLDEAEAMRQHDTPSDRVRDDAPSVYYLGATAGDLIHVQVGRVLCSPEGRAWARRIIVEHLERQP